MKKNLFLLLEVATIMTQNQLATQLVKITKRHAGVRIQMEISQFVRTMRGVIPVLVRVKTLRKHAKIESSRKFRLYHIYTTFLLENVDFLKLS